jgi:hypothetical protein
MIQCSVFSFGSQGVDQAMQHGGAFSDVQKADEIRRSVAFGAFRYVQSYRHHRAGYQGSISNEQ